MKKLNKIASLVLALVLALSLAIPAMAVDGEAATPAHTITIGNAVNGETYTAYKLFDVTYSNVSTDKTEGNFTYTIVKDSAAWNTLKAAGMTAAADGTYAINGFTMTESAKAGIYNVDGTGANAAALAVALNGILGTDDFSITDSYSGRGAGGSTNTKDATATISVPEDGYYFVDSSLGALCALDTTTPTVTIEEKNNTTSIDKSVKDAESEYAKAADAMIGETVSYKVVVAIQGSVDSDYTVTDRISAGLELQADTITVEGMTAGTDYTVTSSTSGYTMVLDAAALAGKTSVTITYDAVVLSTAAIERNSNDNTVTLTYSNQTTTSTAKVYTFGFDLLKYTGEMEELQGAGFTLYEGAKTADSVALTFEVVAANEYRYSGADVTNETPVEGVEVGDIISEIPAGHAHIYGLDAGTYTLEESTVPAGYNAAADTTVVIAATYNTTDGTLATYTVNGTEKAAVGAYDITVENNSGTVMPSTGGIGTTIFYVVGGLLVVCAGVILVSKKRMGA